MRHYSLGRSKSAVLWTGGKDSALALCEARRTGLRICVLVTFVPERGDFKAHPLHLIRAQAESLGIPHRSIRIRPPFARSYETALRQLRKEGISTVVTGDIGQVDGFPSWIVERARSAGIHVKRPLWGKSRKALLERMFRLRIRPVVTAVRCPPFTADWLGRYLDRGAVEHLKALATSRPLDLCGEQGEYHTMTLDGPGFRDVVSLGKSTTGRQGDLFYLHFSLPGRLS